MHWVQGKLKGAHFLRFVMADERHLVEHVQAGKYSRQGHVDGLILRREMVGSCGMEWSTWT